MKIKIKNVLRDMLYPNFGCKLWNNLENRFHVINISTLVKLCQAKILLQILVRKTSRFRWFIFLFISIGNLCYGQEVSIAKPLSVGDTLSRLDATVIFQAGNMPKNCKTLSLDNYKDDLIILDFMNSFCAGCIAAIPKLDSLKNKFEKLKIFMVSPENKEKSLYFFRHNEIARKTKIPMIYGDTILKKLFPHMFISHLVWIKNAKVLAITRPKEVNQENINKVIAGEKINFPIKNDFIKSAKNE